MNITFNDACVLLFVAALLVFSIVYGISQIRWCNKGMRTLKQIHEELQKQSDEPPKEEP